MLRVWRFAQFHPRRRYNLPSIEGEKNTMEGWWQQSDGRWFFQWSTATKLNRFERSNVEHDMLAKPNFQQSLCCRPLRATNDGPVQVVRAICRY